jgi:hypothetical protein
MDNLTGLSLGRIAIGALAWAAPGLGLKSVTFEGGPQSAYLFRLFGARDVALGVLTLVAPPSQRLALVKAGIAIDAADAGAGVLALRSGAVSKPMGVALAAMGAAAAVTGVVAYGQQDR